MSGSRKLPCFCFCEAAAAAVVDAVVDVAEADDFAPPLCLPPVLEEEAGAAAAAVAAAWEREREQRLGKIRLLFWLPSTLHSSSS